MENSIKLFLRERCFLNDRFSTIEFVNFFKSETLIACL